MSFFGNIIDKLKELGSTIQKWFTSKPGEEESNNNNYNNNQAPKNENSIVIPAEGYIMGIAAIGVTAIFAAGLTYHFLLRKKYSAVNQNDPENPAREQVERIINTLDTTKVSGNKQPQQ